MFCMNTIPERADLDVVLETAKFNNLYLGLHNEKQDYSFEEWIDIYEVLLEPEELNDT